MTDPENAFCHHCSRNSLALKYLLAEDDLFYVVCDANPLIEGHILIIPKEHIPCVGAFSDKFLERFVHWRYKVTRFLKLKYLKYAAFEHGIIGQTVFHAHVHFLPAAANLTDIVPEKEGTFQIHSLNDLSDIYLIHKKYLFLEINGKYYIVNSHLGTPGLFRHRFASFFNVPQRGDWKIIRSNQNMVRRIEREIKSLTQKWQNFYD